MASVLLLLQLFSRKLLSATDTTLLVMKVAERNTHADILSICGVHFATLTQVRRNLTRGMLGTLSVSLIVGCLTINPMTESPRIGRFSWVAGVSRQWQVFSAYLGHPNDPRLHHSMNYCPWHVEVSKQRLNPEPLNNRNADIISIE